MCLIERFKGEFEFLSNFFEHKIILDGEEYATLEHAYQASKCLTLDCRKMFRNPRLRAGTAKKLGRRVLIRSDWEEVKDQVMLDLLRKKFSDPDLKKLLQNTTPCALVEVNNWDDHYWGVDGWGKNMLGKLLMQVRDENA